MEIYFYVGIHMFLKCEKRDGYIYMNPGSVSIPKENSAHSYMILEDRFYWKRYRGWKHLYELLDIMQVS